MRRLALPALGILTLALAGCSSLSPGFDAAPVSLASPPATVQAAQAPAAVPPAEDTVTASAEPALTAQRGLASWYGPRFHGRRTASGERFDSRAMTAAHPKLPLGSYARVTLLSSGKSVIVRITDRGPYVAHRVIDLSRAAAVQLGLLKRGVAEVAVQRVAPPEQLALAE